MSMHLPTAIQLGEPTGRRPGRGIFLLLAALAMLAPAPFSRAADEPDPHAILAQVRLAQAAQNRTLRGSLRMAGKTVPFRLSSTGDTVRYEFANPPLTLQLRLGEKDVRFEEITRGNVEKITPARFDDRVRETDITYEDLSLHFLYWPRAELRGTQTMLLQKCWIVRVQPASARDSQYSFVDLWISQKSGALMQAEAFGRDGRLERKFKVISGQKTDDGLWILKQMRIESMSARRGEDRTPTYLDIDGVEK